LPNQTAAQLALLKQVLAESLGSARLLPRPQVIEKENLGEKMVELFSISSIFSRQVVPPRLMKLRECYFVPYFLKSCGKSNK
jgi:hypothetical protein